MEATLIERSGKLPEVTETIRKMFQQTFPGVVFTDIWVLPGTSWYGDEMLEIWAIYADDDIERLRVPEKSSFRTRVWHKISDMGLDASPKMHFVAKSDAGDWQPERI